LKFLKNLQFLLFPVLLFNCVILGIITKKKKEFEASFDVFLYVKLFF